VTCHRFRSRPVATRLRRVPVKRKSGDRSPHSKTHSKTIDGPESHGLVFLERFLASNPLATLAQLTSRS